MGILIIIGIYFVGIVLSTLVFAASLFLVEDIKESSFVVDGWGITWLRLAGIVVVETLAGLLPFGQIIALIVFFVATMALFRKSFGQSFLLLIVNGLFSLGVSWLIVKILAALL